ncbi:cold shock CspA family protein [Ochrobactrum sp. BH3]|nr:cold shock CspA family protein [Ochrobactrum sp. BH3]
MPLSRVLLYNPEKGFGFIAALPCNVFFHRSSIDGVPPKTGDHVRYEAVQEGKASPRATTVRVIDPEVIAEAERVFGPS